MIRVEQGLKVNPIYTSPLHHLYIYVLYVYLATDAAIRTWNVLVSSSVWSLSHGWWEQIERMCWMPFSFLLLRRSFIKKTSGMVQGFETSTWSQSGTSQERSYRLYVASPTIGKLWRISGIAESSHYKKNYIFYPLNPPRNNCIRNSWSCGWLAQWVLSAWDGIHLLCSQNSPLIRWRFSGASRKRQKWPMESHFSVIANPLLFTSLERNCHSSVSRRRRSIANKLRTQSYSI